MNQFQRDYQFMLALSDKRKAENKASRERCQSNVELCAILLADAKRRGENAINWPEYFRNSYIND